MKKRLLSLMLMLAMILTLVPVMASDKLPEASEGFAFHCNDIENGGNPRTYIEGQAKDFGKFDKKTGDGLIQLTSAGDAAGKTWLIYGYNYDDSYSGDWVCTTCGRTDWVSFSNKSGFPDGKNIQLQHPGPSKRKINVTVTYFIDIPECEFTCKIADCGFAIECTADCECGEMCGIECDCGAFDHTCPERGCAPCGCEVHDSEVKVEIINELINIKDGYKFEFTADPDWRGGDLVTFPAEINDTLYFSTAYEFYYEGLGNCVCECKCDGVQCECTKTGCDHEWWCNNCKSAFCHGGYCTNHPNYNGNKTMTCILCGASWNPNQHDGEIKDCVCQREDEFHNPITLP